MSETVKVENKVGEHRPRKRREKWVFKEPKHPAPPPVDRTAIIQFVDPHGVKRGPEISLNLNVTREELEGMLNELIDEGDPLRPDKNTPYSMSIAEGAVELTQNLATAFDASKLPSLETALHVTFFPLSAVRVRAITRQACAMSGHAGPILTLDFSPDGTGLVTGSGDTTIRFWDLLTHTPRYTLDGHTSHVLYVKWCPQGDQVASADERGNIRTWDPNSGKLMCAFSKGHKQAVTGIEWEPMHLLSEDQSMPRLASCSKDSSIRIWDVVQGVFDLTLSGHTAMVTAICWSGEKHGRLYSSSRDRTVKVWDTVSGCCLKSVTEHGHWLNHLCLNTATVIRSGCLGVEDNPNEIRLLSVSAKRSKAKQRYETFMQKCGSVERLVGGSDDFTISLWRCESSSDEPLTLTKRLTGHSQPVNFVNFSPDGRLVASCSFDKAIKIWDACTGTFIATLRGHVGRVYVLSWSPDCRMLASGGSDSLIKLWDVHTKKWKHDLPGHADEVWALQWNSEGGCIATGGRDKVVKIWRN
eukprot:GHVO01065755.1.p1 GENE.GHVO01065755.1~~GHVO01065755.1.p1  ORF type:complete len:527 (+),score=81.22 GHVO01065755.1:32-1612(+)